MTLKILPHDVGAANEAYYLDLEGVRRDTVPDVRQTSQRLLRLLQVQWVALMSMSLMFVTGILRGRAC